MTTTYAGIDYGRGITNRNLNTGIRYGVISQNDVLQAWADSSEPHYEYHCPHCGSGPLSKGQEAKRCPDCYKTLTERDMEDQEPKGYIYQKEGYVCECGESGDIFITKSPYYTYAQFCSPCAPGACHLRNPLEDPVEENKCYCFGHDWFDTGTAPYVVYSVETNEVISICTPNS